MRKGGGQPTLGGPRTRHPRARSPWGTAGPRVRCPGGQLTRGDSLPSDIGSRCGLSGGVHTNLVLLSPLRNDGVSHEHFPVDLRMDLCGLELRLAGSVKL